MAYEWTNGELITAEKLNNTGGGGVLIISVHGTEIEVVLESTWQEIHDAFTSGVVCLLDLSYEGKTNLYALTSVTSEPNDGRYNVFFDGHGSNLGYTANSANGYPSQSFD